MLTAKLVDKEKNAKQHRAVVAVETDGVAMVSAEAAGHEPKLDQAHLQYRLDKDPVQNSASKSWTFENLSPGEHEIRVSLASGDDHPIGMSRTLKVKVP